MEPHLLFLLLCLLLSGFSESQTHLSVTNVSVQREEIITIPFLYGQTYKDHKKYCYRGSIPDYKGWYAEVHNGRKKSSQYMSLSDDVTNSIFTLTVRINVREGDPKKYHCSIERGGKYNEKEFRLLDTAGTPELRVQNQTVFGCEGESVVVECYHRDVSGERKWCRIGGSCLVAGEMDGMSVDTAKEAGVFRVTLRSLQEKNSGWYWCSVGEFQMPVHITVRKRTSLHTTTITKTSLRKETSHIPSSDISPSKSPEAKEALYLYCLLGVIPLTLTAIIFLILKKHKNKKGRRTDRKSNPESLEPEVIYISPNIKKGSRKTAKPSRQHHASHEDVTYSSVARLDKPSQMAADDVTYSHVSHQSRGMRKSLLFPVDDNVTYSAVVQGNAKAVDDVTYSHVSHQSRGMRKSPRYPANNDVTYCAVMQGHVKSSQ